LRFVVVKGFDFVGVDFESSEFRAAFFAVRFGGGGVAAGVPGLTVGFGLEGMVSGSRGKCDGCNDNADGAADLFGGEQFATFDVLAWRKFLSPDGAEQLAQNHHEQVAMDAVPAAAFEVIQTEFFFRFAETVFNRPATEGDAKDHPQCPAIATRDTVREEVFHFVGEHVASDNQSALVAHDAIVMSLSPAVDPAGLPDLDALVRLANAIPLRCLFVERG